MLPVDNSEANIQKQIPTFKKTKISISKGSFPKKEKQFCKMFYYSLSDIGQKRTTNQDQYCAKILEENIYLFIVCDGMGGANGGCVASTLAIDIFCEFVEKKLQQNSEEEINKMDLLYAAAKDTNDAVFRNAKDNPELSGMGTTLVAMLACGTTAYIINIGDSRLYTFSETRIKQVTKDHSFVQQLLDLGKITEEEVQTHPNRNIITQAIGVTDDIQPDLYKIDLSVEKAKYILLCSDGLHGYANEEEFSQILFTAPHKEQSKEEELKEKTEALIMLANKNGGGDNITAILIDTDLQSLE